VNNELFEKLIRFWRQRKDPTEGLTPQEIAFHLFGKGSSDNVTKTLHILWEFKAYFYLPSTYGKKWRVNWTKVQTDYPNLQDSPIWLPRDSDSRPKRQFLEWHADTIFRR
jgi:hypothetical protein